LVRSRQLTALAYAATDQTPASPEETWWWAWAQRCDAARSRARQQVDHESDAERRDAALARLAETQDAHSELLKKLGPGPGPVHTSPVAIWTYDSDRLWQGMPLHDETLERAVSESGGASISLNYERVDAGGFNRRLIVAGCVAALTMVTGLALAIGVVPRIFKGWPVVFGVTFGLAWWMWLSPSFVGWIVVAIVLLVRILPCWRRVRTGDSGIIMVSYGNR
jgi:hypothetical protein